MHIEKFTLGMGDRFAQQGKAQLKAIQAAWDLGIPIHPVWNKSHREHALIGSRPDDLRAEADTAVEACGWSRPYHVDADHIRLETVDAFIASSDFYTLDVADFTGKAAAASDISDFETKMASHLGHIQLPGLDRSIEVTG